jgi:hypothetical protein
LAVASYRSTCSVDGIEIVFIINKIERIHFDDIQSVVIRRQFEHALANRDDRRVQLNGGNTCGLELTITEFSQRTGSQTKLNDVLRFRIKQHPDHHLLRVFEFDRIRFAQAHRALYPFGTEMQKRTPSSSDKVTGANLGLRGDFLTAAALGPER